MHAVGILRPCGMVDLNFPGCGYCAWIHLEFSENEFFIAFEELKIFSKIRKRAVVTQTLCQIALRMFILANMLSVFMQVVRSADKIFFEYLSKNKEEYMIFFF